MLAAGMLGLLASMVVAVWAYFAHEVAIGLHPSHLKDKLRSEAETQALTRQIVEGYIRSVTANVVVLGKSTRRFRVALVLWIVSICLLAFAALGLIVTWTP